MSNIKKGDRVIVTTGRDKGKKGEVLKVFPKEIRALVSGINVVEKIGSLPTDPPQDGAPTTPVVMSSVTVSTS